MGNRSAKSNLRNAIIYLNISANPVGVHDDKFWSQIWTEEVSSAAEVIKSIRTQEIRMLRDGSPQNFATLVYKMVERLCLATGTLCNTQSQQTAVLNATRILIRILPCIFEDSLWCSYLMNNYIQSPSNSNLLQEPKLVFPNKSEKNYKSYLPTSNTLQKEHLIEQDLVNSDKHLEINDKQKPEHNQRELLNNIEHENNISSMLDHQCTSQIEIESNSMIKTLILSTCDLLFCPEFTVTSHTESYLSNSIDTPPEDLKSISTCDYVWEPGVGFESSINSTTYYDKSRSELLRLLLTCLSSTLYETPSESINKRNYWIEIFSSSDNRHALPLFTSLLNTIFTYKPGRFLPFNHLIFEDKREELVELSVQVLIATLDYHFPEILIHKGGETKNDKTNLFIEYASRIHRTEDFAFIIEGFTRLLNKRLEQSYLPNSTKHINFDQELLVLFWRLCNLNKKFMSYLPKTGYIHDIIIPILYHLNENFQDPTKTALIHIGVFNLLILSGERNFGVKLNKPLGNSISLLSNLPTLNGSHADLMVVIVHKLILYGHNLNQLFNFLMTIIVNISPYLKALSMLACKCLIQLFEIFSSPFVIFTEPNYHQLVIFLLEVFNNLVQYQFDGNANLVYTIINKSEAFLNLANLPSSQSGIQKVLNKLIKKKQRQKQIEKLLLEQQHNSENPQQPANDQRNSRNTTQLSEISTQLSATVSSSQHAPASPGAAVVKQEVSLVATPDICKATQLMHPGEVDSQFSSADFFFALDSSKKTSNATSVDEILDQACSSLSEVSIVNPTNNNKNPVESTVETNLLQSNSPIEDLTAVVETTIESQSKKQSTTSGEQGQNEVARWRATPEWVKEWKQSLPLHTVMRMIEVLAPHIERIKSEKNLAQQEEEMIKFLQDGTLVGLLPVPHPIVIRKYRTNNETTLWFRACTWGIIYVRNTIWTDTAIRLIKIVY